MLDFEKLGQFYLGKVVDPATRQRTDALLMYDAPDLVTHAVCVGMTGSGKTGLCLGLLEEAAIDGVPAIVIDPKGDLANLMLMFPGLSPEEFAPWVNPDEARRRGLPLPEFARQQAELWRSGLEKWGQSGQRISRLRSACDIAVYTPGSAAGVPLAVLRSLAAPPPALRDDPELLRERTTATVSGLLGLLGIDSDPRSGREHILLATILGAAWQSGRDMDLPALIAAVQSPPVQRVGVMEIESFFPAKDRFGLAMAINNLLASPGFAAWAEGVPLDIQSLLYTPAGKPRLAIVSIAHLDDAQRMFVVSLLMNEVLAWARRQSGTTSLRALVYMDEIAGYVPPVASPPSKAPILTLMKQARAFGVGIVLATQNPVDIDYKGLGNAGTWFIGRLQTERDRARLLDGLEGAAAASGRPLDRAQAEAMLAALPPRTFLLNNVHEDGPVLFETRWVLSYLRGPMTRDQIRALTDPRRAELLAQGAASPPTAATPPNVGAAATQTPAPAAALLADASAAAAGSGPRPVLPAEVPQCFLPIRVPISARSRVVYRPMILGLAKVFYSDAKLGVELEEARALLTPLGDGLVALDWDHATPIEVMGDELDREPVEPGPGGAPGFGPLPAEAARPRAYDGYRKQLADALYRSAKLELLRSARLGLTSAPGESERDFRARAALAARERRDEAAAKLRAKYAPKLATLAERLRRAEQQVEVQQGQAREAKVSGFMSLASGLLGALTGRKALSAANASRVASAARGVGRASREAGDVGRAMETVQAVRAQAAEVEAQLAAELDELALKLDPAGEELQPLSLKPKKTNITVKAVILAWAPHLAAGEGEPVAAF